MIDKDTKDQIASCLLSINCGDNNAIEKLHSIIAPTLRYIALKYIHDSFAADDVVQDFWANIYKFSRGFIYSQNAFSYLCKIMTRMSINYYKKHISDTIKIQYVDYSKIDIFAKSNDNETMHLRIAVSQALESLDEREKIVVQETYFENQTIRQIAKTLGISKSLVANIRNSALSKLKSFFEAEGAEKHKITINNDEGTHENDHT